MLQNYFFQKLGLFFWKKNFRKNFSSFKKKIFFRKKKNFGKISQVQSQSQGQGQSHNFSRSRSKGQSQILYLFFYDVIREPVLTAHTTVERVQSFLLALGARV